MCGRTSPFKRVGKTVVLCVDPRLRRGALGFPLLTPRTLHNSPRTGVVSGLGKGVTASSIGVLLQAAGLRVTSIKIGALLLDLAIDYDIVARKRVCACNTNTHCWTMDLGTDPYLNTDAGTMSPFEHGEVFVLDDGGEVRSFKCPPC
eukprot:7577888-Pyramimonas_sp.AAC.2